MIARTVQQMASLGIRFLVVTWNLDTDESNPRFLVLAAHPGGVCGLYAADLDVKIQDRETVS